MSPLAPRSWVFACSLNGIDSSGIERKVAQLQQRAQTRRELSDV